MRATLSLLGRVFCRCKKPFHLWPGIPILLRKTHALHAVPRAARPHASAADGGPLAQLRSLRPRGQNCPPGLRAPGGPAAGGRRHALWGVEWRGRRTGSCPHPHPPPLPPPPPALAPPPSRNRVPRGHPQGTSRQTPACPRPPGRRRRFPAAPSRPVGAWCRGAQARRPAGVGRVKSTFSGTWTSCIQDVRSGEPAPARGRGGEAYIRSSGPLEGLPLQTKARSRRRHLPEAGTVHIATPLPRRECGQDPGAARR